MLCVAPGMQLRLTMYGEQLEFVQAVYAVERASVGLTAQCANASSYGIRADHVLAQVQHTDFTITLPNVENVTYAFCLEMATVTADRIGPAEFAATVSVITCERKCLHTL